MIVNDLVCRHTSAIFEATAKHDIIAIIDRSEHRADVSGIVLAVTIESDHGMGTEQFGGFNAGFDGGALTSIDQVSEGHDAG